MAPLPLSLLNLNILQRDASTHVRHTRQDVSGRGVLPPRNPAGGDATTDNLSQYLASLGLRKEEAIEPAYGTLVRRGTTPLSPRDISVIGRGVSAAQDKAPHRGAGAIGPNSINNKGMLALFALLFAGLIISAIWFFFWARNGGFYFKEGDWEDYKSTVLRRKGPNGTTLSGATKTTDLGQQSIAGTFDEGDDDLVGERVRDSDMREYRHETSAKVGGINKEPDGSYYDHDTTELSSEVTAETAAKGKRGFWHRGEKPVASKNKGMASSSRQPSTTYSFTEGDDGTTVSGASEYVRPNTHRPRHHSSSSHSNHRTAHRQHRPSSGTTSRRHHTHHPPTISEVSYSSDLTSDLGTKIYNHSVPGLLAGSVVARTETTFEPEEERTVRREREREKGYRRGGGRRRDSLSDSDDGETVA
ncbi:MAG: hypothetical protein M1840_005386 [Geoglossum simile]|nr:MAG: hypothetical protein M1840_005386 [Geoglossum simile]